MQIKLRGKTRPELHDVDLSEWGLETTDALHERISDAVERGTAKAIEKVIKHSLDKSIADIAKTAAGEALQLAVFDNVTGARLATFWRNAVRDPLTVDLHLALSHDELDGPMFAFSFRDLVLDEVRSETDGCESNAAPLKHAKRIADALRSLADEVDAIRRQKPEPASEDLATEATPTTELDQLEHGSVGHADHRAKLARLVEKWERIAKNLQQGQPENGPLRNRGEERSECAKELRGLLSRWPIADR